MSVGRRAVVVGAGTTVSLLVLYGLGLVVRWLWERETSGWAAVVLVAVVLGVAVAAWWRWVGL